MAVSYFQMVPENKKAKMPELCFKTRAGDKLTYNHPKI